MTRLTTTRHLLLLAMAACAAAGCAQAAHLSPGRPAASARSAGPSGSARVSGAAAPSPSATGPATAGYRAPAPPRVHIRHLRLSDGNAVTVARFTGAVRFVLHTGSADPGQVGGLRAGPAVGPAERRRLLAAFNGGFKLAAGAGGYKQEGHVVSPLVRGRASLVIYRSGKAVIGVWGKSVPNPRQRVYSVRQNLGLLVSRGHPTAAVPDWQAWGATLGGGELVARSAIGQTGSGQLIYAGSMSATPGDLATALIRAGAKIGMELDINPEWVQLGYAKRPGWPLRAGVPGQYHPGDQYLAGWTRDFIAVLGASARASRPLPAGATPSP